MKHPWTSIFVLSVLDPTGWLDFVHVMKVIILCPLQDQQVSVVGFGGRYGREQCLTIRLAACMTTLTLKQQISSLSYHSFHILLTMLEEQDEEIHLLYFNHKIYILAILKCPGICINVTCCQKKTLRSTTQTWKKVGGCVKKSVPQPMLCSLYNHVFHKVVNLASSLPVNN